MTICVVLLDINSIASGLKDLETDLKAGASSFVISLGVRINADGRIVYPKALYAYSLTLKVILVVLCAWVGGLVQPHWLAALGSGLLLFYAFLHLRMLFSIPTFPALREMLPLLGGYFAYASLLTLLAGELPPAWQYAILLVDIFLFSLPVRLAVNMSRKRFTLVD